MVLGLPFLEQPGLTLVPSGIGGRLLAFLETLELLGHYFKPSLFLLFLLWNYGKIGPTLLVTFGSKPS